MYAFNSAAIFSPGHPYIESTTVLSDTNIFQNLYCKVNCLVLRHSATNNNINCNCTIMHIIIIIAQKRYNNNIIVSWRLAILMSKIYSPIAIP